ncbi:MAG: TonB-dependent receptor [Cyclobacteriaceae bacterium]|nr:TonB-dependent receptor [Cyclobacteriaceae bacterium]
MTNQLQFCCHAMLLSILLACLPRAHAAQSFVALAHDLNTVHSLKNQNDHQPQHLVKVLEQLEKAYHIRFAFQAGDVENKRVKADLSLLENTEKSNIEDVLKTVLDPLDLTFKRSEVDDYYVIRRKEVKTGELKELQSVMIGSSAHITDKDFREYSFEAKVKVEKAITGKVTDLDNGEALVGVNVVVKGTTIGTVTDIDGNYRLIAPDDAEMLVFSSVGYLAEEVAIGNQTVINITLSPDIQSLSEVVVVGYGTQEKRDLTGSVSSVESSDIENVPSASLDNLLQGKAAGVQVVQGTGAPGGGVSVRIRGNASVSRGNSPLYVVDGVPLTNTGNLSQTSNEGTTNALADINPNDIESIEVLKDASAASIYGVRGGNGVVLITTKRGQAGKAKFNLNFYQGVQQLNNGLDYIGARDNRTLRLEALRNAGTLARTERYLDSLNISGNHDVDHIALVFRSAPITNFDASVRGGTEKIKYALTAGYFDQVGIIPNSGYRRYSTRVNVDYDASDRVRLGSNLSYTRSLTKLGGQDDDDQNVAYAINNFSPFISPYIDGKIPDENSHALNFLLSSTNNAYGNRLVANEYLEIKLLEGLKFRTSLAIDYAGVREEEFYPSNLRIRNIPERSATEVWGTSLTWINENIVSYQRDFQNHNLEALAGYSVQETRSEFISASVSGAATDDIITLGAGSVLESTNSNKTANGLRSVYGRVNYKFKDRYLLTVTVRSDASSRFGRENRTAVFPSAAIGWRVSDEPFLSGINAIDNLKLRFSYGQIGNESGIADYAWQGAYYTGQNYNGAPGIAAGVIPNQQLGWETQVQANLGLDLTLWEGRINFTADVYNKQTNNLLFNVEIPQVTGFSSILKNVGKVENRGIELGLNANMLQPQQAFGWNLGFNVAFLQNRVLELPSGNDITTFYNILREDEPIGAFYLYNYQGVYATDEDVPVIDGERLSANGTAFRAGDAIFEDLNDDGVIDNNDLKVVGSPIPDLTGGINNTFTYQGFELSAYLNFSRGSEILNLTRQTADRSDGNWTNITKYALDRWQQPGDQTEYPRRERSNPTDNDRPNSTLWLESGDFLRLKTLTFAYRLPSTLVERISLSNVRFYVTGQNLLTFTPYRGWDPEVITTNNRPDRGIEFGVDNARLFPLSRTVIFGINVGF